MNFYLIYSFLGGTSQATARFQDSDIFQKAVKMAWSASSHLSGFKLKPGPTYVPSFSF